MEKYIRAEKLWYLHSLVSTFTFHHSISKLTKQKAHGPRFSHLSHCISADAIQLSSSIAPFTPYKSMGLQIWPCHRKVKGYLRIIIWPNLVDLVPDAIYQESALKLSWFWRSRFLSVFFFYHIWTWWTSWLMMQNLLNKLIIPLLQKAQNEIWWKLVKLFQRRRSLKIKIFYTCI